MSYESTKKRLLAIWIVLITCIAMASLATITWNAVKVTAYDYVLILDREWIKSISVGKPKGLVLLPGPPDFSDRQSMRRIIFVKQHGNVLRGPVEMFRGNARTYCVLVVDDTGTVWTEDAGSLGRRLVVGETSHGGQLVLVVNRMSSNVPPVTKKWKESGEAKE